MLRLCNDTPHVYEDKHFHLLIFRQDKMIIAQRQLYYSNNGRLIEIPITISAPFQAQTDWFCEWSIGWPHGVRTARGYGADSVQALRLTFEMTGAEIYASPYHANGGLYFKTPNSGYGFPVPANMRDMLIGEDKIFF